MNHHLIFGTPIFRYHKDPTELRKIAEEKFELYKGYPLNEAPEGWDCNVRTEFSTSIDNNYGHFYTDIIDQFKTDVGLLSGSTHICESWLNYYSGGHNQEEHDHNPGFFSGIHYLKFNPEVHSPAHFVNPCYTLFLYQFKDVDVEDESQSEYRSHHWYPDVKEGDIIIFPSWLRHMVREQKSNETRISLAFNINTLKGSTRRVFNP